MPVAGPPGYHPCRRAGAFAADMQVVQEDLTVAGDIVDPEFDLAGDLIHQDQPAAESCVRLQVVVRLATQLTHISCADRQSVDVDLAAVAPIAVQLHLLVGNRIDVNWLSVIDFQAGNAVVPAAPVAGRTPESKGFQAAEVGDVLDAGLAQVDAGRLDR